jgi:sulfur carrier protein
LFCVLEQQGLTAKSGIAVAVNQSVISKSNWATTTLEESSKILIIQATQGG